MTDFIDVVEHNPIVFVKAVTEALGKGYTVQNTNAGYPQFNAFGNTMRLFKGDRKGATALPEGFDGLIEQYDPMALMLAIESAVGAGYKFKENGKHFFDQKGLKTIELELPKEEPAKEEKTPAKKAPAKKALKAEPTKEQLEGDK